jgi:hypothetical protein
MKVPSGQTFSNYPGIGIQTGAPIWANNTSYKVGDVVKPSGGGSAIYLCAQAGTSHASTEPSWPGIGEKITDNSVVWLGINAIPTNAYSTPLVAGDLGEWKKVMVSGYIGKNVTFAYAKVDLYRQSDNSDAVVYLAEPFVQVGTFGPSGVVEGKDEHEEYLVIGGRKISFGSAAPTSGWWNRGDVRFNSEAAAGGTMGWMCVTAGSPGTWKAMANLAN